MLERRAVVGGAAVTEEIAPGFRASIFSYLMSLLHPRIIRDFELGAARPRGPALLRHGLAARSRSDYIVFSDDMAKTQASFARFSRARRRDLSRVRPLSAEATGIVRQAPVGDADRSRASATGAPSRTALRFLWRYRRVGRKLYRIVDLLTMSAYDFLREWFEDDRVMAVLAYYASIGTFVGPKTPGSAYVIMHHLMGEHEGAGGWGFIKGGMGAITQALAAYGRTQGRRHRHRRRYRRDPRRRTAAPPASSPPTATRSSRAGHRLQRQRQDPLSRPAAARALPAEVVREIEATGPSRPRSRSTSPASGCRSMQLLDKIRRMAFCGFDYPTYTHIAPDIDYLERAYDDAKHGAYSRAPVHHAGRCRASSTTRWRRRASTSSTCSAATRRTR